MNKEKIKYYVALEFTPGVTYTGAPLVDWSPLGTIMLKKSRHGNDLAAIKRALPRNHAIFSIHSRGGKNWIEFAVLKDYVPSCRGRMKNTTSLQDKTKVRPKRELWLREANSIVCPSRVSPRDLGHTRHRATVVVTQISSRLQGVRRFHEPNHEVN